MVDDDEISLRPFLAFFFALARRVYSLTSSLIEGVLDLSPVYRIL